MAGIKDIAKGRSDLFRVHTSDLHIKEGWNSRDFDDPENKEHVDKLAQSIAAVGVKQPLTAYLEGGKLYIEDGESRFRGALRAIEEYEADPDMLLSVRMSDKEASDADRVLSQIVRNSGKPFSPLETATVYKRLKELGLSDSEIARQTGVSRVYVAQLVGLADMRDEIKDLVRKGRISATLAIETVQGCGGDEDAALKVLRDAVAAANEAGKERATAKHVRSAKEPRGSDEGGGGEGDLPAPSPKAPKAPTKAEKTSARVEELQRCFKRMKSDHDGWVRIPVEDYEAIAGLLDLPFDLPAHLGAPPAPSTEIEDEDVC
ncbi:ParB/RepB/Spo0J family partition protein [Amorphus orientalis]|uniref:ParB/RepB/Spo0J family partition protein n=1 Tax=Amorphus orientalis TaxID=649198 RepID=A0AAE3VT77_9HYPH|nr:hypothetical protein [Amorphus orientalis]MDQ0317750.1 ParB/RepB/Spo0J family partition protein [Amorphus orientalis]